MKFALLLTLAALGLSAQNATPIPKSGIDKTAFDPKAQPCDDFWRYANGGWVDQNPIPAKYPVWGSFVTLQEQNTEKLRTLLEAEAAKPANAATKVGSFYAACMDTAAMDKRGWSPLEPAFARVANMRTRTDIAAEIRTMETYQISAPLNLSVDSDLKDSKSNILFVGVAGLSLPEREYYLKDDDKMKSIRAEFLKHAARMMELTGIPAAEAKTRAEQLMAFEKQLAEAQMLLVDKRNPEKVYNKTDLAGLKRTVPSFNWEALLDSAKLPPSVGINMNDPGALKGFEKLLAEASIADWQNYLRWRWLNSLAGSLSKDLRDQNFAFKGGVLVGSKEQPPRWQTCSELTDNAMGELVGQAFVAQYFPPRAKARMTVMIENLRETLREEIGKAPFLSDPTRKEAIAKLNTFLPKIGYPDKWRDYSGLNVARADFLANVLAERRFNREFDLSQAGKPVDRMKWQMTPPTVNAYYNPSINEIVFPAGILQPPFFDMDADDAANYGAIGAVIGHEMGHGFDDQGSKFDSEGNMRNWWTEADRKKFDEERAACIIDQFDNIDVGGGLKHNGRLVTGEALGDVGGLTLAYKAYHRSLQGKPGPVIDGLTADQRFFLAFARVWGLHARPEYIRQQLQVDPHPLAQWRTNGTVMNMPEFHRAFSCKAGDPMVRPVEKQCKLW